MKQICVLVSGSGTNLQRLIDCIDDGVIKNAQINLVVADRECAALKRADRHAIKNVLLNRGDGFSEQLLRIIPENTDLIVLAGFLSILKPEFCKRFARKIINIHPALLPKFGGKGMWGNRVHEAVLAAGEKTTGATVHFVTSGIDEGEIILQKSFIIEQGDTAETLAEKVHAVEYELLPEAVDQFLNSRKRIAFITDLHMLEKAVEKKGVDTVKNWKTVLRDINEKGIEDLVLGGDLGEKEALKIIFNDLENFNVEVILGNHDKIKNVAPHFSKAKNQNELFYSSKIFGKDCIFLDTSSYRLSLAQQDFLKNGLEKAVSPVIFIHHPILGDQSWMDKKHPLKNRDELTKILRESGKNITVISGHYHHYHDDTSANVRQVIAPAVSYQILNLKNYVADTIRFGYLILDFSADKVSVETVNFAT